MAKARASDSAWSVTASALQVFGGIGFTWEHDLQFLLKRARVDGELLGSARAHRDQVAGFAGLGEPVGAASP
jgi:alkylation response protein AidB-like acyl-CoA dehydrogenase